MAVTKCLTIMVLFFDLKCFPKVSFSEVGFWGGNWVMEAPWVIGQLGFSVRSEVWLEWSPWVWPARGLLSSLCASWPPWDKQLCCITPFHHAFLPWSSTPQLWSEPPGSCQPKTPPPFSCGCWIFCPKEGKLGNIHVNKRTFYTPTLLVRREMKAHVNKKTCTRIYFVMKIRNNSPSL